jgi:hypothetical protein
MLRMRRCDRKVNLFCAFYYTDALVASTLYYVKVNQPNACGEISMITAKSMITGCSRQLFERGDRVCRVMALAKSSAAFDTPLGEIERIMNSFPRNLGERDANPVATLILFVTFSSWADNGPRLSWACCCRRCCCCCCCCS